jgi:hypothetical protein
MTLAMHDMEIREEAREEGIEIGIEKGTENAMVSNLRTVMEKMKLSAETAMDFLNIPAEDQPRYAFLLKEE